mgnify:CR=1 FL=1
MVRARRAACLRLKKCSPGDSAVELLILDAGMLGVNAF